MAVPIPLFDRQRKPRARATARILTAESQVAIVRADVRNELELAWEAVQAARRASQAVATISDTIDRDIAFVDQAVRAGAFDALTRTHVLRRLQSRAGEWTRRFATLA